MNKNQIVNYILALVLFALVALNGIFAFGVAGSTNFVQVFFAVIFAAVLIYSLNLSQNADESKAVIGATLLYFASLIARAAIYFLDAIVNFIGELVTDGLFNSGFFGDLLDLLCVIVALSATVFAVLTLIAMLLKKDFSDTLVGKFTSKILAPRSNKEAKPEEKIVSKE